MTTLNEPYPNIGYILNRLADMADTKSIATKGNNRYRKEEDFSSRKAFDPALIQESIQYLFFEPIDKTVSRDFACFFSDCIWIGLNNYLEIIKLIPTEGVSQEKVTDMLNKHLVVQTLASVIWKVGKDQMPNNTVPSFYCDKNPIQSLISFYESQSTSPDENLKRVFADNIRTANKWCSGEEIPNIGHLSNLAHWAALSNPDTSNIDKVTLFLSRFIASFHKKTQYKYVEILKEAVVCRLSHNQDPTIDFGTIFQQFYAKELQTQNLYQLSIEGKNLHRLLNRSVNKPPHSLDAYSSKLSELVSSVEKKNLTKDLHYHSEWLWGRIHILSGQFEQALDMYVKAVESSLYKSGDNTRHLLKEALAVAAIQNKPHKPTMKKLKSRALTFCPQIIEPHLRDTPVRISEEDIDDWRFWFVSKFPKSGWFEEGQKPLMEHLNKSGLSELAAKFV